MGRFSEVGFREKISAGPREIFVNRGKSRVRGDVEWGEEIGNVARGNLRKLWKWRGFFEETRNEISDLKEM